ncbi:hypothetical protein [Hymenobacter swuensis]|uniref:Uncharacterized protein n=1 Tax=Hymenobacter swuensis DY53 TaxID=1227739 RepID=W8F8A2_9BACT|nr:hypothetical protein [Hymenobacter swuensis]AHJ97920.1 hypothetical protein Hsw_2325 [Hymenobacter swuensis DY53]
MKFTPDITIAWKLGFSSVLFAACTTQPDSTPATAVPAASLAGIHPVSSATRDTFSVLTPHTVKVYLNSPALYQQAIQNGVENYLKFICKPRTEGLQILFSRVQDDTAYVTFEVTDPTAFTKPVDTAGLQYAFSLDIDPERAGIDSTFTLADLLYISSR